MAERKKLDTEPKLDGAVTDYPEPPTVAASIGMMATIVRFIKNGRVASVTQLQNAVQQQMKKIRLRARKAQPIEMPPGNVGSGQVDLGSIIGWTRTIKRRDEAAKAQLAQIAATLKQRLS